MNNFLNTMNNTKYQAEMSINNSFNSLKIIDEDFQKFLLDFFKEDINKNLFVTQIFYNGSESIFYFQDYLFKKTCDYLKNLVRIDGLSFYFDANIPLSSIDIILSDTKIASINIFHKQLTLYEEVFFETINRGIDEKTKEKDKLILEYNKCFKTPVKNFSINENSKMPLNKISFKKDNQKQKIMILEDINFRIMQLDNEISELYITKNMLEKNLTNIKYFQEKISSRIYNKLKYNVIIN